MQDEELGEPGNHARWLMSRLDWLQQEPALAGRKDLLIDLREAISKEARIETWAAVDLSQVFTDDAVDAASARRKTRQVSNVELLRNMLLLLPLLITWYGIATATAAYGDLLAREPTAARSPFIQLWEQGFQGEAEWYVPTFSQVGLADILAIIAVIFLSGWVGWLRRNLEVAMADEETAIRNILHGTMAVATVFLAERSLDSPNRFATVMNSVATQMDTAGVRIEKAADSIARMPAQLKTASTSVSASASLLVEAVGTLRDSLDAMKTELSAVVQEQSVVAGEIRTGLDGVRGASQHLGDGLTHLDRAVDKLGRAAEAGNGSAAAMSQTSEQLASSVLAAAGRVDELRDAVKGLAQVSAEFTVGDGHLARMVERAGALGTAATEMVAGMAALCARLERAAKQMVDAQTAQGAQGSTAGGPPIDDGGRTAGAIDAQTAVLGDILSRLDHQALTRAFADALLEDERRRRPRRSRRRKRRASARERAAAPDTTDRDGR